MKGDPSIPENWSKLLQRDCADLVKRYCGVKIDMRTLDIMNPKCKESFNLVVEAMGRKMETEI